MTASPRLAAAGLTVGARIAQAASERTQATFLREPGSGRALTYGELGEQVPSLAGCLRARGLGRGDRIALAMENGIPAVLSHLAAMSGGFVPLPLDPLAAPASLAALVRHSGARLILTTAERRAQAEAIVAAGAPGVGCLEIGALVAAAAATSAPFEVRPDDDALLMYTSGSTGRPRGVLVTHAGMVARAGERARAHELGPADRLLCTLPLHHMNAQNTMLGILVSGGSMVVPARFQVASFWDWVIGERCTWISLVPSLIAQLLRWAETHPGPAREDLRHVRFARCSSAPLGDAAHRAFEDRFGIVLVQGMGMTEAGGIFVNPPHRERRRIGSLGLPCGVEARIVGADGRDLGRGQVGDLLVRGPGVMRGYLGDPEATAGVLDAAGWLRTGDLVQRDADGYYWHAGRAKELIIKGGTNVSPLEVDEALAAHPAVAQAAAVGVPHAELGEDIGAFVVLREAARCSEAALLEHCQSRLGEFRTPSWIRFVDALPTGPTGKVRRAELARRAAGEGRETGDVLRAEVTADAPVAPRTEVESAIAAAWAEVLGRESFGVHDHFFALGGSSLLALNLTTRLRRALGVHLSLGALLGAPTIAAQAALVAERRASAGGAPGGEVESGAVAMLLSPVEAGEVASPLFCIHDIARFRRLAQLLGPRQPVYGVAVTPAIAAIAGEEPVASFSAYSVEDLARACVPEVRRLQPGGPYRIAGFSFGGRIAYEVAQHLRAAGEPVSLLVIFDTFMPGTFRRRRLSRARRHLEQLRQQGPSYLGDFVRRRVTGRRARERAGEEVEAMSAIDRRYADFRAQLRTRYHPRSYGGRVVLFRATVRDEIAPDHVVDPLLGWGRIATGEVLPHDVPGAHLEMLDEMGSVVVARELRRYLA